MIKKLVGAAMSALLTVSLFTGAMVTANAAARDAGEEPKQIHSAALQPREEDTQTESNELAAYLFVHFVGSEGSEDDEQIYFSVSQNGTAWKTLNGVQPVLRSEVGERGVRDPHILRKPDGSGFYLIATDLSIYNRHGDWGGSQTAGSRSIVVWESVGKDITKWTCKGLKEIARENATCTWAPEVIYDDEREAYMIFWASKTKEDWNHRVYRCYTEDFETFTPAETYIEGDVSMIDTTFIKEGDVYYRFTKDEAKTYVYMEKSKSLSGDFSAVNTYSLDGKSHTTYTGYEGPTVYKLNGENKWCLLLDNYGKSAGYKPFVTDDISTGRFTAGTAFDFGGTRFRHGTVMPITQAEYDALVKAYPFEPLMEEETGELVYQLDFEDNLDASTGTQVASANGSLTYEAGVNGGKAVKLSTNNYVSIDGAMLKDLTSFTVSFAAKVSGNGNSWLFFAAPNTNQVQESTKQYLGALYKWGETLLSCERFSGSGRPQAADGAMAKDEWAHVTIVYRAGYTQLYVNGAPASSVVSKVNLAQMLGATPVIQLGKANWGGGEYANALLDCFKIHNYALSADEAQQLYTTDMGGAR